MHLAAYQEELLNGGATLFTIHSAPFLSSAAYSSVSNFKHLIHGCKIPSLYLQRDTPWLPSFELAAATFQHQALKLGSEEDENLNFEMSPWRVVGLRAWRAGK